MQTARCGAIEPAGGRCTRSIGLGERYPARQYRM